LEGGAKTATATKTARGHGPPEIFRKGKAKKRKEKVLKGTSWVNRGGGGKKKFYCRVSKRNKGGKSGKGVLQQPSKVTQTCKKKQDFSFGRLD